MSKKLLPLAKPPITTFPSYAAALGIMANYEESYDWFYSQYIQLCTVEITNPYKDENTHSPYIPIFFVDTDTRRLTNTFSDYYFLMRENCPYLNVFEMSNEMIESVCKSFVDYVKRSIDLNMYIFTFLDVSKINQYKSVPSGFHEIFIYGYDDEKKQIYFADFPINDTFKYSYSTCSYEEIENAYVSMNKLKYPVTKSTASIKYTNSIPYRFELSYVKECVAEYLYPDRVRAEKYNNYIMALFNELEWKTKTYLGIDIYDFFINYIENERRLKTGYLSVELFHGLFDHKEMMIKRLEYFRDKGYLKISAEKMQEYTNCVRRRALATRNQAIKYLLNKKESELDGICNLLDKIKTCEVDLLKKIFEID